MHSIVANNLFFFFQIFGETTTYVDDATAEKLLSAFKFENLRKRVRYQCGFDIELSANPKR